MVFVSKHLAVTPPAAPVTAVDADSPDGTAEEDAEASAKTIAAGKVEEKPATPTTTEVKTPAK